MITKAFSPEQSALGTLENGMELVVLYIKEYKEEAAKINNLKDKTFTYNWFNNPKENSYVLQAFWTEEIHMAIKFDQQHFPLLAQLIEPKTLVISTVPITELVIEKEVDSQKVTLEFSKDVVSLSNIRFEDPKAFYN